MKKSTKILLIVLCVVFVGVFGFSAFKIASTLLGYKKAETANEELKTQYVTIAEATPTPVAQPKDDTDPEVSPINVDFSSLRKQNEDCVAWIYGPNSVINYPIVWCDNNFYYLDHLLSGEQNANGTIFVDTKCGADFSDQNTIVYGHNMNDGSMFASLRNYRDESYYEGHEHLYMSTPNTNYRIDVIAGFVTEPTSYVYANTFEEPEQFEAYIESIKSESNFKADVDVKPDDKIVTLSTCTYEIDDGRYVIIGKLVKIH